MFWKGAEQLPISEQLYQKTAMRIDAVLHCREKTQEWCSPPPQLGASTYVGTYPAATTQMFPFLIPFWHRSLFIPVVIRSFY